MLGRIYGAGRFIVSKGWIVGVLLIVATVRLGFSGFLQPEGASNPSWSDALYKAISLLAIQTGAVPASGNRQLEIARWCGMLFWASALIAVAVRLFQEPVHNRVVKWFAKDHVVIAGLGQSGWRLVQALRAKGRTVVIIEPNRNHPAVDQCRKTGAVVLFGEPDDERALRAANLSSATTVLSLFLEEFECVRIAAAAYRVLGAEKPTRDKPPVHCILRLTDPRVHDVVRRHNIKTDRTDRSQLEILNSHEIAAASMVREAMAHSLGGVLRKAMILGLGSHHRLGEMVALRAAKDHLIEKDGYVSSKLELHVFDRQASEWLEAFRSRYPFVDDICSITAHGCWARKVGASRFDRDYDAAFVCIPDEGHATAQAAMLRRDVLTKGQPIMVRVLHSRSGYGELIGDEKSGWGENIHPVGLEDPLFEADTALQPELELRARTIHQAYKTRTRSKTQLDLANVSWDYLHESFRDANRKLAERYAQHLAFTDGVDKTKRYHLEFHPDEFTRCAPERGLLFRFSDAEVETLGSEEHRLWKEERERAGWKWGPVKDVIGMTNPLMVDYAEITDAAVREYNRDFIRSIPRILALADYTIEADEPDTPNAEEGRPQRDDASAD